MAPDFPMPPQHHAYGSSGHDNILLNLFPLSGGKDAMATDDDIPRAATIPTIEQLFHKVLTATDVGRRHGMAIRRADARRHLPPMLSLSGAESQALELRDSEGQAWVFRYTRHVDGGCFFSRGWRMFVEEKRLRVNDTVRVFRCEEWEGPRIRDSYFLIDVEREV